MATYELYGKSKLAKGFSYPVSYTTITTLIESGAVPNASGLWFVGPEENRLLCGRYSGPRSRHESAELSLWVSAVPSALRKHLKDRLIAEGFAALSAWASQYKDPTLASSRLDHSFTIRYRSVSSANDKTLDEFVLVFEEDRPYDGRANGRYRANIRHNSGGRH